MDTATLDQPVLSTGQDIAAGQLTSLDLQEGGSLAVPEKAALKYDRMPIKVSQSDLIRWWDLGAINTAHFIRFALMIERVGEDGLEEFDIAKFCGDWIGTKKNGEPRCVNPKQVMNEIQMLQQIGAAHVQTTVQMSLDLSGGYDNAE